LVELTVTVEVAVPPGEIAAGDVAVGVNVPVTVDTDTVTFTATVCVMLPEVPVTVAT
jgi:hypothetical protein